VERPLGVVLADGRHAEDRHNGVSDELLYGSAPCLDNPGHRSEIVVEDRTQPLRIQALAEGGGPDDVREKDSHQLPLARHPRGELSLWRSGVRRGPSEARRLRCR